MGGTRSFNSTDLLGRSTALVLRQSLLNQLVLTDEILELIHIILSHSGWGANLDGVVDIRRQQETTEDGGSVLLRVSRASTHGLETLLRSNRK